ncbi:SRR1 family protein [Rhodotorula toruloides]|uniref:SRR1 family protein n=1 Tax=Rhodotorula toruloides TaxID=5286 RepID=A0A511KHZ2_RHOTO|nr:SRR1 family protein [Rhodotorula toruloides]
MRAQDDADGFTSVTHKKPARPARNRRGKERFRERTLEEKLEARRQGLRESSLSESTKAQDQYVLLQGLLEELEGVIDEKIPTEFYDPVFAPEDTAFLTSQGHAVLSNPQPLRLTHPTLLYIPHGPRTLFESLLRSNWTSATQLEKVVVWGNRLDLYDDPTYSGSLAGYTKGTEGKGRKGEEEGNELSGESAEFVVKAAKLFHILPLPDPRDHLEAFNDLALQWIVPERARDQSPSFWLPEPREGEEGEVEAMEEAVEKLALE